MCASSTRAERGSPAPRGRTPNLLQEAFFLLFLRPFVAMFFGVRVRGREHLPESDPFILVANHSSHLDTAALLCLFPLARLRRVRPCAAADYFERTPLIAFLSRTFFNILPIHRVLSHHRENPAEAMCAALDRGETLLLFPEGTRGGGTEVGAFKPGIAHVVERRPDVPVVPAFLCNMGRALPKGELLPVPFLLEIRIGEPLRPRGSREDMMNQLREALVELANERA